MPKKQNARKKNRGARAFVFLIVFALLALGVYALINTDNPVRDLWRDLSSTPAPTAEPTAEPTPAPTPTPEPTAEPTPAPSPVILEQPYYLVVDRGANVVTAYTLDADGTYSLVARTMVCCTDQMGDTPPNGLYRLDGEKKRWYTSVLSDNRYWQYATRVSGKVFFLSMPYADMAADSLDQAAFGMLGESVTDGSVWLTCADAKWIYDNVEEGTPVRFLTGGARDESIKLPALDGSPYDPTDDDPAHASYDPALVQPAATPYLGVTPKPTPDWTSDALN